MRRSLSYLLTATGTLCLVATLSAQSVATDPVGFSSSTVQAGSVAALAVPFDRPAKFVGPASSRTSTTIQVANAGWAANAFGPFNSNPHMVRMLSGASKGRDFMIDSNTADTLTITQEGDLTGLVAVGDRVQVYPCHTLSSLFGADAAGLNSANSAAAADNIQLREGGAWLTYFHTAGAAGFWAKQGGGATNFNNHAIFPEQGLLLVRRGQTNFVFTGLGAVPTTELKTDFAANAVTSFANRFPVSTTLGGLGLHLIDGWTKANTAANADQVLIRDGGAWLTYFRTTTGIWAKVGGGSQNFENTPIPIGASVLVVRRPGANITLTQALPYAL